MKVVKVYGALREQLGQSRFEFVADTPAQALKALLVNFPGLEKWLLDSEKHGVAYRVTVGKQRVHNDDASGLFLPWSEQEVFSITPVLMGSGRGGGMFLMGALLVGVAVLSGGAGLFAGGALGFGATTAGGMAAATFGVKLAVIAGNVGIGLMLTGVAQMISPTPKPPGIAEEPTRLESNSFSGIVNTTRQGVAVPIAYGRVFVGSVVISAGLDVDQV